MKTPIYLVATPIGNLSDLSARAIEILTMCDIVAAEDSRNTANLLQKLCLNKKIISYHNFNEQKSAEKLINLAKQGTKIALVSDGGSPCIADPGYRLVKLAQSEGVEIIPIPGACAIITALMASGLPSDEFHFYGFLPEKNIARTAIWHEIPNHKGVSIFLVPPHDAKQFVAEIIANFGNPMIFMGRELTKIYEEKITLPAQELAQKLANTPKILGEIVMILDKIPQENQQLNQEILANELINLCHLSGISAKSALEKCQKFTNLSRNNLYKLIQNIYN